MEKEKTTAGNAAGAAFAKEINIMDILQSKEFEADIVGAANKLDRNAAARLREYRYFNGIWKPADIAEEYRAIMIKQSAAPSTVRRIIVSVCKDALSCTISRMAAQHQAEHVEIVKAGRKKAE